MSNTTTEKKPKKKTCAECCFYRAMVYRDDGADAFCGRCTLPITGRIRQVRSAVRAACGEFVGKGEA